MDLADKSVMTADAFLQWIDGLPEGERYEMVARSDDQLVE